MIKDESNSCQIIIPRKEKSLEFEKLAVEFKFALDSYLHALAGIILLLFAASHFGFLTLNHIPLGLKNNVFPFITNWTLYLLAALYETGVGIFCISSRGRGVANIAILIFVASIAWYRWAFYYTGGTDCGCMGLLGKLLHISKSEERRLPIATLILLVAITIPWFLRIITNIFGRVSIKILLAAFLTMSCYKGESEWNFALHGIIDSQDYNPMLGTPYAKQQAHSTFLIFASEREWKLKVVNTNRPDWWVEFYFDGTNSYSIAPGGGGYYGGQSHQTNQNHANIMPSSLYQPEVSDPLGVSVAWFTYGVFEKLLKTNELGLVVLPAPWTHPRDNPFSYGFKWEFNFSAQGRFVNDCQMVRDQSLDVDNEKEMFEPELDYPETLADYNSYLMSLKFRKAMETGFVGATFKALAWFETNQITLPIESELTIFAPNRYCKHPQRVIQLKAQFVGAASAGDFTLPGIEIKTDVADYRFKKSNDKRIFKYAEYTNNPGDSWKSGDEPSILAGANNWLDHGRKFKQWANNDKLHGVWIIFILLQIPLALALFWFFHNKLKKQT